MAKHEAMDAQTVADLLGVSTRMLNNYINHNDLPSIGSGRARTFVWSDVLEWFVNYRMDRELSDGSDGSDDAESDDTTSGSGRGREDIRKATLRKTIAEADIKQLALSKQRSEVVTIADAKTRLDRMLGNLRAKLLAAAPKLANRLEGLKDRTEKEAAIKDELAGLCRELSTGSIVANDIDGDNSHADVADTLDEISAAADPSNLGILRDIAELLGIYDAL